ncbi:MAG: YraN family protein [Desulforhopalus sp.]|nr:YraN family protein [Desulforhopalus sp.]
MLNREQNLGQSGENIAAEFLTQNGYKILERNYRCLYGEIDIIARAQEVLVFVEVKTRTSIAYGSPASAITPRKQRQISKTAQHYLAAKNLFDTPARFDVVSICIGFKQKPEIELLTNAFDLYEG